MEQPRHVPVLSQEVLEFLTVRDGAVVADLTLGLGGHSEAIARHLGGTGRLLCFDRDPEAMALGRVRLEQLAHELGPAMPTVEFVPRPFSEIAEVVAPATLDGLLADFGVSSLQLDMAHRGFSFRSDGPLDMRMDTRSGKTAEQVVNEAGEEELANLIYEFGEERRSRKIARAIVRARPILTTAQLAQVVSGAAHAMKGEKIHPATRTFQALRIHVNDELNEIRTLLATAESRMRLGGRVVMISFHSLEDRMVKDAFRAGAQTKRLQLLTKKPVVAGEEEQRRNPRSRSAKLRAAEVLRLQ